jgi:membrane protein YqaA with SNARE-associated domain
MLEALAHEEVLAKLMAAAAVGGFLGSVLTQTAIGCTYLRRIIKRRCTNHAQRLTQLEGAWLRHAGITPPPSGGRRHG